MREECKDLKGRMKDICNGDADLPLHVINKYRKFWGLEPFSGALFKKEKNTKEKQKTRLKGVPPETASQNDFLHKSFVGKSQRDGSKKKRILNTRHKRKRKTKRKRKRNRKRKIQRKQKNKKKKEKQKKKKH